MPLTHRSSRTRLAIDMGRRVLRAVEAELHRGRIVVRKSITVEAPETLEADEPQAAGLWLAEALAAAGMTARRAVFAVNRESASHKRLLLATTHREDFADMTRLAMQRELGPAAEGAVIDFIPFGREENGTVVHALAVPQREIDFVRSLAQHAGLVVDRISLRTFGSARLVETLDDEDRERDASLRLAIDLTGEGLELCFLARGEVTHSRGAEIRYQRDVTQTADAAITEARRSWAAWRLAQPEAVVDRAVILGERETAQRVADGLTDLIGGASILERHPRVTGATAGLDACWPLAGMLLEASERRERIDLAAPRRAPDLAARRRMQIYSAVGSIVLAFLVGWTVGGHERRDLQLRHDDLESKAMSVLEESQRFKRDFFRAQHLAAWQEASPDWLATIVDVGSFAPDPSRVVFDLFLGTLESGAPRVVKEPGKETRIALRRPIRVFLEGEALDRPAVDALREAFVKDRRFAFESPGTDKTGGRRLQMPFTFILRPAGAVPGSSGSAPATGEGAGAPSSTSAAPVEESRPAGGAT